MHNNRLPQLSLAIGLSVVSASALASPQQFMSARSFAMGGTGVAIAHPADAAATNPAMMAGNHHDWSDDFGLILPSVNARAADEEETVDQVDDIQDVIGQFESAISGFDPNTDAPQSIQDSAADLRDRLVAFDKDTVRGNAGLGLALAVPSKTVSVGFFTNANLTATVRGELSDNDEALLDAVATAATAQDVDNALDLVTNPDGSVQLDSRARILASAVGEAGISFARQFELNNGNRFQLGLSPKYVELRTFQYTETVSGFEDDNFDADENQTDKSGFNVDIGAAYRFGEDRQWNAGLTIKNLIPMELDSAQSKPALEQQYTLKLDPMVTAGIAHIGEYHVITAELDLTKKEAFGYEDDTQWLALGAEFDVYHYAQLRVGVRQNLASNDDNDGIEEKTQFTAGLGLNLMGVRMDLGALVSDADVGAALEFGTAF
ncbi:conjugal transfer protein TraF [Marinobacter sp. M216]|uniref:Conjugal transfer protein TraF n=1 Tax=Marinobacter albus TaxID=3030833 RepID=A0ABT7HAU9_9GAMM|nr:MULTISPECIES: conjugal transfer protein TraF [unclassified Marinobacter]MBW7471034.1 conjugal transfer protein TraF [Marinobacter sp. F4218]MDK9556686.1 conjugal transfer protein TraF [Marinobacter sp. M216]